MAVAAIGLVGSFCPWATAAELPGTVSWTAVINDVNVDRTSSDQPVVLDPARPAQVTLRIENLSDRTVTVPYIRLEGVVLGMTIYSFTTRVDLELLAGEAEDRAFPVPLLDLGNQASGLIPSHLALLDAQGQAMSERNLIVDVRGKANSVYAVFGLAIGALALLRLASALWRLATGRLNPNRWRRGLTLAGPGLGLGFLVTFSLSAWRIASPQGSLWATLLLSGAALGFAAGYSTPTPGEPEERDEAEAEPGHESEAVPAGARDDTAAPGSASSSPATRTPPGGG
ncbi:hypothetical protein ACI782_05775 [Geodermatophilus sp. SYSU D00703]